MLGFSIPQQYLLLAFLLVFGLAIWIAHRQTGTGLTSGLRNIPAFDAIKRSVSRSVESGRPIHLGLGVGGVSNELTGDSLAALEIVEAVSQGVGLSDSMPTITLADSTLLPLVQQCVRKGRGSRGYAGRFDGVRWLGPNPTAYAAGVMETLGAEKLESSILAGVFGDEYLLLSGAGRQRHIRQFGAVADPIVLPFVFSTADELLMGEELYAAGAYLSEKPWHLGSLRAQDWMRWILVLVIFGIVIVNTFL